MPTQSEYTALLAAERQTAARVEALELHVAHLQGSVVGLTDKILELTELVARLTATSR